MKINLYKQNSNFLTFEGRIVNFPFESSFSKGSLVGSKNSNPSLQYLIVTGCILNEQRFYFLSTGPLKIFNFGMGYNITLPHNVRVKN